MTFHGEFRGTEEQAHHLHESPTAMTVPLHGPGRAARSLAGFLGIPPVIGDRSTCRTSSSGFLHPVLEGAHHALEQVFPHPLHDAAPRVGADGASSVAVAVARHLPRRAASTGRAPELLGRRWPRRWRRSTACCSNKYYVDELYDALFVRGLALGGGRALLAVDRHVVDGGDGEVRPALGVNGIAWLVRDVVGRVSNAWDRYVVDGAGQRGRRSSLEQLQLPLPRRCRTAWSSTTRWSCSSACSS